MSKDDFDNNMTDQEFRLLSQDMMIWQLHARTLVLTSLLLSCLARTGLTPEAVLKVESSINEDVKKKVRQLLAEMADHDPNRAANLSMLVDELDAKEKLPPADQ